MSTLIQLVSPELRQLILKVENKLSEMIQEASNALLKIGEANTPLAMQQRDALQALVDSTAQTLVRMGEFSNLRTGPGITDEAFIEANQAMFDDYQQQLTADYERASDIVRRQKALAAS